MVDVSIFAVGNAKGSQLYSSTIVSIYLLGELEGSGPLKSKFNLSKGCVAFTRVPIGGRK